MCVHVCERTCIYICTHGSQRSLLEVFLACFLPLKKAFSCMYVCTHVCMHTRLYVWMNKCVCTQERQKNWILCELRSKAYNMMWMLGTKLGVHARLAGWHNPLCFPQCWSSWCALSCTWHFYVGVRIKPRSLHFCDTLQTKPSHESLDVI